MVRRRLMCWLIGMTALLGCVGETPVATRTVTLVSTTSTQDSGLLDILIPAFEQKSGIDVHVVAVGSGQALELGRRGDADLLLTHSPEAELRFMNEGWGKLRRAVMHNDFVLLGPQVDLAGVQKATSVTEAFRRIETSQSAFVSRGDDSGTHIREKSLWKAAAIVPSGDWYISAGAGMAQCLRLADEKHAYILCDRGTYLSHKDQLALVILNSGDEQLLNQYSVVTLDPAKHPHLHHQEAEELASFLVSSKGQAVIGQFGVDRFGQSLFIPDAIPPKDVPELPSLH